MRVERHGSRSAKDTYGSVIRGRKRVEIDLKSDRGREQLLGLVEKADVLVEGMRPGVMERLGLGPAELFERNARLIFGRMTGWGQTGPLANHAGHDINYIALSGVLSAIGPAEKPAIPLNLIGDFGGGGCFLLIGILSSLARPASERHHTVIDCAMVDGASVLMSLIYSRFSMGQWADQRESNPLDGGVPWYDTYATQDGKWVAVGALEQKFYDNLVARLGLEEAMPDRDDEQNWPTIRRLLAEAFVRKTRDEWADYFDGVDACVSPVLTLSEAPLHPQLHGRGTIVINGAEHIPAPAPIFGGERTSLSAGPEFRDVADIEAEWS